MSEISCLAAGFLLVAMEPVISEKEADDESV